MTFCPQRDRVFTSKLVSNSTAPNRQIPDQWRILQVFNSYRLGLGLILFFIYSSHMSYLSVSYSLFAIGALLVCQHRIIRFQLLATGLAFIDILFLGCLLFGAGGVSSGLGLLISIAVAGNSLLLARSGLFALLLYAIVITISAEVILFLTSKDYLIDFMQLGLLTFSYVAIGLIVYVLAQRASIHRDLADRRADDLERLGQLNGLIIEKLNAGILVIDSKGYCHLSNQASRQLLHLETDCKQAHIKDISEELTDHWWHWQMDSVRQQQSHATFFTDNNLSVQMIALGEGAFQGFVFFIEDTTDLSQQAQQMKLASLGRFTASIAHELRNPLGAIAHAAQLLQESSALQKEDSGLVDIIVSHGERMNGVIKNILQLSRRKETITETIDLSDWLPRFIDSYQCLAPEPLDIQLEINAPSPIVHIDGSQLQQILTNLVDNGLRHSKQHASTASVIVHVTVTDGAIHIDVIDQGPGVPPEAVPHLFEPFYTTERLGTGLGLYIAKELCEANRARLQYIPQELGACFRLLFHGVAN
jgi:two-component system, NtrC family, sensor histidine kinase PilS